MTTLHDAEVKLIEDGNEETAHTLETFESRWRYAVFPAMIAFFILSAFGFYLIYGILQRMEVISEDITRLTNIMEVSVPEMSSSVKDMNTTISQSMPSLEQNVSTMTSNMTSISQATNSMANSTHNMGQSTWEINRSISKPMRAMNKVIPWNVDTPPPMMYRSY